MGTQPRKCGGYVPVYVYYHYYHTYCTLPPERLCQQQTGIHIAGSMDLVAILASESYIRTRLDRGDGTGVATQTTADKVALFGNHELLDVSGHWQRSDASAGTHLHLNLRTNASLYA